MRPLRNYKNEHRAPGELAAVYGRLATLRPDDLRSHIGLAQAWLQAKEYDKAIPVYQKILEKWPKESSAYAFILADTMIKAGKKKEAVEWAKGYYEVDSVETSDLSTLAEVLGRAGEHGEAIGLFLKAAEREADVQKKLTLIVRAAKQAEGDRDWARAEAMITDFAKQYPDDKVVQARADHYLMRLKNVREMSK